MSIAIGVRNLGYFVFWEQVFQLLHLRMGKDLASHLKKKDEAKKEKQKYEASHSQKKKRARYRQEKMKDLFKNR